MSIFYCAADFLYYSSFYKWLRNLEKHPCRDIYDFFFFPYGIAHGGPPRGILSHSACFSGWASDPTELNLEFDLSPKLDPVHCAMFIRT